jgi:hypothetical protein
METMNQMACKSRPDQASRCPVHTTLYGLIEVLNQEVQPDEDWIVTVAVLDLFESGRAKFMSPD